MKRKDVLVSVILPVFNSEKYLSEAVASVLNQTYKNIELIVVDDGSTDSSGDMLKDFSKRDKRIRLYRNKANLGISKSINMALTKVKGKYIARMDADDISRKDRIKKQVDFLRKNKKVVVVGSDVEEIDGEGRSLGKRQMPKNHKSIYQMMNVSMGMQHPTLMFNTELIPAGFEWYRNVELAEDLDLLFRLEKYGKYANISEKLLKYRKSQNTSLKSVKDTFENALKVRKKAVLEYGYKPSLYSRFLQFFSVIVVRYLSFDVLRVYGWYRLLTGLRNE